MSNTVRPFTVLRRRLRLLDILVPKMPNQQKYRLLAASNFDGTFVQICEADIGCGFLDPALMTSGRYLTLQDNVNPNQVRLAFDPQSFAVTASIDDANQFWLQLQHANFAGAPDTPSPPTLILPEEKLRGDSVIVIAGTAPSGADVGDSLQLNLPYRMQDVTIRNDDTAHDLYVAMEPGGSELLVKANNSSLSQVSLAKGAQGCLLVRGSSGTAVFSVTMTSFLPL